MGRKKLPYSKRRDLVYHVRFLNSVKAVLEKASSTAGHDTIADYIRDLVQKDVYARYEAIGVHGKMPEETADSDDLQESGDLVVDRNPDW